MSLSVGSNNEVIESVVLSTDLSTLELVSGSATLSLCLLALGTVAASICFAEQGFWNPLLSLAMAVDVDAAALFVEDALLIRAEADNTPEKCWF